MAETVVSMARSMYKGRHHQADHAAAELSLVMGMQKDIWFIKDELKTMQAFLAAAEATKHRDMLLKLKDRRQIAIQIRNLKSRVEEVSSRNKRYNLIKTEGSGAIDDADSYSEDVRNHSSSNIDEGELVGFAEPKKELIELVDVNTEDGPAKVICVIGMGAWITVSQSFFKIEMLKDMIRQLLLGVESLKKCLKELEGKVLQVKDLAEYLREELKDKRYFIVRDDLWTLDTWRWIEDIIFPSSNKKGSRIIVTTRDVVLAKECTP
ncbi:hypothetical protein ACQ4PT_060050 [Festuca glaucescens]